MLQQLSGFMIDYLRRRDDQQQKCYDDNYRFLFFYDANAFNRLIIIYQYVLSFRQSSVFSHR